MWAVRSWAVGSRELVRWGLSPRWFAHKGVSRGCSLKNAQSGTSYFVDSSFECGSMDGLAEGGALIWQLGRGLVLSCFACRLGDWYSSVIPDIHFFVSTGSIQTVGSAVRVTA